MLANMLATTLPDVIKHARSLLSTKPTHWSIKIQIQRAIKSERLVQIENCFLQNEEDIQRAKHFGVRGTLSSEDKRKVARRT